MLCLEPVLAVVGFVGDDVETQSGILTRSLGLTTDLSLSVVAPMVWILIYSGFLAVGLPFSLHRLCYRSGGLCAIEMRMNLYGLEAAGSDGSIETSKSGRGKEAGSNSTTRGYDARHHHEQGCSHRISYFLAVQVAKAA